MNSCELSILDLMHFNDTVVCESILVFLLCVLSFPNNDTFLWEKQLFYDKNFSILRHFYYLFSPLKPFKTL